MYIVQIIFAKYILSVHLECRCLHAGLL